MNLVNARILITGATGGIGSALATQLRTAGAELLLHGHSHSPTGNENFVRADLSQPDGINRLVEAAVKFNINVLINNSGINELDAFEFTDVARLMQVNAIAPMLLTQALLPHLKSRKEAVIYNIGSTFGQIGFPGYVAYSASKHAVRGFSEALRRELFDSSVKVLHLSPRSVGTSMSEGRAGDLNRQLGSTVDTPAMVAGVALRQLRLETPRVQIGFIEMLQVKLNGLLPGLVDGALQGKLSEIKSHFTETVHEELI